MEVDENCTVLNVNSLYARNMVTTGAAVMFAGGTSCAITNVGTTFAENTGNLATIAITTSAHFKSSAFLTNNASTFR